MRGQTTWSVPRDATNGSRSGTSRNPTHLSTFLMKKQRIAFRAFASLVLAAASQVPLKAGILVGLEPAAALYDSNVKGIINDAGNGPAAGAAHLSGIPEIGGADNAHPHTAGFTFNVEFVPNASDLTGTKLLIEVGALSNGSGLYLIGGVPTLLSKQGGSATAFPTGLNDTTLNAIAVQSSIGVLQAGVNYSFSASWNHLGTLELKVVPSGGGEIFNSFGITGNYGNWSGNDTLSVKTLNANNAGGLGRSSDTITVDPRFNTDAAGSFAGQVVRALFWNAADVTPLETTAPVIRGFSVTTLPSQGGRKRLHWNLSEGGLPNPTTAEITDADDTGGTVLHTIPETQLVGFADLDTAAVNFKIKATNATGFTEATDAVEQDTPFSTVVRASDPLAWFRFNETAGSGHVVDSADNVLPFDGTVIGQKIAGATGFVDGAASYNGTSTVLGGPVLNPGLIETGTVPRGFTVESIIRYDGGSTVNQVVVAQTDVNGIGRVILAIETDGTLYSNLGNTVRRSTAKLKPGKWTHVALVVDPTAKQLRWYVDGAAEGVNTVEAGLNLESSEGNWVIGSSKVLSANFLTADLDEVAIYGSLLDDPDENADFSDSRIGAHHLGWYALTRGILKFETSALAVSTGSSAEFNVYVGSDVTSVTFDYGTGSTPVVVPVTAGKATLTITPTETRTYQATAAAPGGVTYTESLTIIYNQLTEPVILGFEATTLPSPDGVEPAKVRLHWAATAGDFPTPVAVKLTWGTDGLFEATALRGHHDIPEEQASDLEIEITNLIGTVTLEAAAPAADTPYSATVREAQPVAWYRFNESSFSGLIVDSASNEAPHNGVLLNGVAVNNGATGFIDGAATFNASAAIITDLIIDPDTIEYGFTIEAIVETNPGNGTANRVLVSQRDLNGTGRQIFSVDDVGQFRSQVGGGTALYATGTVPARAWSHLVGVVDAYNNEVRWYIDGQFAGSATPASFFEASDGAWILGAAKSLDGNFWRGKIDDLVIYNKLLDDPDNDGDLSDSLIVAHRDAWWQETSGLLYFGPATATIDAGGEVGLTVKVGADVTGVSINPGSQIPIDGSAPGSVKGSAVVNLSPSQTTEYTVTYQTPSGPVTRTITVTVNGAVETTPLEIISTEITGGNFIIRYRGAAATTYAVKGSETLDGFTADFGTTTTDSTGEGAVSIPVDPSKDRQFFRIEAAN